ncbi:inositol monophosphatase family protein [Pseudomonas sp. NA-150]|uniref:inositol monophosphatase family protein n=1 Tax=Pseudomonas sp. NA-150 TaxID=3367525 RepID=UPI0037C5DAB3
MNSTETAFTAALLRSITDEIASRVQSTSGRESIPELIERVSTVSRQAQAQMRAALAGTFPDIGWNESEDKHDSQVCNGPYWVYDPIDGAYHYLQGLPLWSSSLALVKDGKALAAFVYDPCQHELFAAQAGKGPTLNGQPIKASAKTDLHTAVVGTALPPFAAVPAAEHALAARLLVETSRHVFVMRQMAAASLQLAYVAAGRLDAYVETGDDVYDWIAGCLLVQEAGGVTTSLDGTPFDITAKGVLAAATGLHAKVQNAIASVIPANA